jgi:hypothetical protein
MDLDTRLIVPPHVMSRLVGEETVLLDLASGMYFGLDGVGKTIWESISMDRNLAETIDAVVTEYDVEKERAEADVIEFTSSLVERGLLKCIK